MSGSCSVFLLCFLIPDMCFFLFVFVVMCLLCLSCPAMCFLSLSWDSAPSCSLPLPGFDPHLFPIFTLFVSLIGASCVLLFPLCYLSSVCPLFHVGSSYQHGESSVPISGVLSCIPALPCFFAFCVFVWVPKLGSSVSPVFLENLIFARIFCVFAFWSFVLKPFDRLCVCLMDFCVNLFCK